MYKNSLYRPHPPVMTRVSSVRMVSRNLKRITFQSDAMNHFPRVCPAAHIKLFIPPRFKSAPQLPGMTKSGPRWPDPENKPFVRTFSVRTYRPEAGEISIEFSLHHHRGPASDFARRAKPGDQIGITYPGGPDPMIVPANEYRFLADMSALPALSAILERLPPDATGYGTIGITDTDDIRDLDRPCGIALNWAKPEDGLHTLLAGPENTFYWTAGEHSLVLQAYQQLSRWKVPRRLIYAVPYWKRRSAEEQYHGLRHKVMKEELTQ